MKPKRILVLFVFLTGLAGIVLAEPASAVATVRVLPGSVATGFHITLKGRKIWEEKLKMPGFADLTGYILEQSYRKMRGQFDRLGCELQFYDYPFLPFDDYYTRDEMSFIRGKVPNENATAALGLVAKLLQNVSSLTQNQLERAVRSCVMNNRMRVSLGGIAKEDLRKCLFPGEYPSFPTYFHGETPELSQVKRFMKFYLSPSNMIVSVVGDVDGKTVEKLIGRDFSGWGASVHGVDAYQAKLEIPVKKTVEFETRRKSQGYVLLARPLKKNLTLSDIAALLLLSRRISDEISFQLREREGLAYSIGAGIRNIGDNYFLVLAMGTAPKYVKSAADRMNGILTRILSEKAIPEAELERFRNSLLISRIMKRLPNVNKAFFIGLNTLWSRPENFQERVDNAIKKVDIDTLVNAKKLLTPVEIRILINASEDQVEKTGIKQGGH